MANQPGTQFEPSEGSWNEIRNKIRAKWAKFTDQDIDSFKGNLSLIKTRLQKVYGYSNDQSEREFTQFRDSIQVMENPSQAGQNQGQSPLRDEGAA